MLADVCHPARIKACRPSWVAGAVRGNVTALEGLMVPNGICASHSYSAPPVATNGDNRPTMEPDAFHASRSSLGFGREDARHNDSRGLGLIVVSPSSKTEDKYLWRLAFDRILLDAEALIIIRRGQPRFCSQRLLLVYRHHRVCCFGFCLLYDRRRQAARSVSRRRGRQARAWSKFPRREASRVSSRGGDPSRGRDMNGIVMHGETWGAAVSISSKVRLE